MSGKSLHVWKCPDVIKLSGYLEKIWMSASGWKSENSRMPEKFLDVWKNFYKCLKVCKMSAWLRMAGCLKTFGCLKIPDQCLAVWMENQYLFGCLEFCLDVWKCLISIDITRCWTNVRNDVWCMSDQVSTSLVGRSIPDEMSQQSLSRCLNMSDKISPVWMVKKCLSGCRNGVY